MTFKMNRGAVRKIMQSDEVYLDLFQRAEAIREAVDPDGTRGYVAVASVGRNRARATVIAAHPYARNSNAKHNSLIKNLDKARD